MVGQRHGTLRNLCTRHYRDVGHGEVPDRLGGVREGAPHRRQHHPKWTDEALKAISLTAEGLMEPNTLSEGSWTCTACAQGDRPMVLVGVAWVRVCGAGVRAHQGAKRLCSTVRLAHGRTEHCYF